MRLDNMNIKHVKKFKPEYYIKEIIINEKLTILNN